ncbi:MAG TPA: hypothetical protein PLS31_05370 [Candidatus Sumerlaeota bacterium]|nr:MAG: hypothetical protein BWY12_01365 [candidate division BRC1 bacterium ADurb.Bin183]HQH11842.1 hypothetical protein [Candidatus Sumerlaeota bacterium]
MSEEPIILDCGMPLSIEEADSIEAALLELLKCERASLKDRFIAGAVWLELLRNSLFSDEINAKVPRDEVMAAFFKLMKDNQYGTPLRIAAKAKKSEGLCRMLTGLIIAARNQPHKHRSNLGGVVFVITQYLRHLFKAGKIKMAPLEKAFPYLALENLKSQNGENVFSEATEAWVRNHIQKGSLRKEMGMRLCYGYLIFYCAIARMYAAGLAWGKKSDAVCVEDVNTAFSFVDDYYFFHRAFDEIFTYSPVLKDVLEKNLMRLNGLASLI